MACKRAVAMFMCVSRVCFRCVSSGNAVMAILRCAALLEKSLKRVALSSCEALEGVTTYI